MQTALPFLEPAEHLEPQKAFPAPVFVRHPRARRYVVSVREDGGVRVTLPRWGSMREAREFAGRLDTWIDTQRRRLEAERRGVRPGPAPGRRPSSARARLELPPRLLELAREHDLHVPKVSVRNQRWRWG